MADFNLGTSLTQNWDARGRVFYTDENGNKVDLNTPFLERVGNRLRKGFGAALQGASFLPIFNVPYVGTGIGGAMFEAGNAIREGRPGEDIAKDAAKGFVIGETVGAIPYVGKGINKLSGGKIGNVVDDIGRQLANTKAGQTVTNYAKQAETSLNNAIEKAEDFINTKFKNKQIAYHGSPYDFTKFSNEAIGTGEGAQAHGYGHYSALDKGVADKRYRNRLKDSKQRSYTIDNVTLDGDYPLVNNNFNPESVIRDTEYYGGKEKLLAKYKKDLFEAREEKARLISKYPDGADPYFDFDSIDEMLYSNADILEKNMKNKIPFLESILDKEIKKNEGQLYKLSIPKDEVMLREDLPINQQSQYVQKAINNINKKLGLGSYDELYRQGADISDQIRALYGNENIDLNKLRSLEAIQDDIQGKLRLLNPEITGKTYYSNINKNSDLLSQHGIKGISYNGGIDGEARVIFNPDDIEIVRKYYNQPNLYDYIMKNSPNIGAVTSAIEDI